MCSQKYWLRDIVLDPTDLGQYQVDVQMICIYQQPGIGLDLARQVGRLAGPEFYGNNIQRKFLKNKYFTSTTNGSKNVWGRIEQLGVATNDYYFGQKFIIEPTDSGKSFDFGHALIGDVDFSHSYIPTAGSTSANQSQAFSMTAMALKEAVESNLDVKSELVDGKVHFSIDLQEEGVVGTQFNIKYDETILTLENVIFDTGNTMSNFANHKQSLAKVNIGSLDQNGNVSIKQGTAYKLVFTANETLQNTSGLITFKLTEGIKADGQKVKFIIK